MNPFQLLATLIPGLLFCLLTITPAAHAAGNLYRYQDESGHTVIGNTLPQAASRRGYEILNSNGRVLQTVAPALTEEEKARKLAEEAERQRQAALAEQRRKEDRRLLRIYSHPDDVIRALHRKLDEMRSLISLKQGNIENLESQIRLQQSRAADSQRAGRPVPEQVLAKIDSLRAEISGIQAEIHAQEKEVAAIITDYKQKIERLEILTETTRTLPLDPRSAADNREARAH